jgi:hypothetical protein
VNLHYAIEYPQGTQAQALTWLGGVYEPGFSVNPMWTAHVDDVSGHEVRRGVPAFAIDDEWYFNMRFVDGGVTAIVQATPDDGLRRSAAAAAHPGRSEVMAWAFERPAGGRSFAFSGGHWYGNWLDSPETPYAPAQRRVVAQGILWTAGVTIPDGGVAVDVDPAEAGRYISRRP